MQINVTPAADLQTTVRHAMNELGLCSVGRSFGLDRVLTIVHRTHPSASRSDVWEITAQASLDAADAEADAIAYEDCIAPAWGEIGYDC